MNGTAVLDAGWKIADTVEIPATGALAFGVEKGKASFDDLTALRNFGTGRIFGESEALIQRTDSAGITTYFNPQGDIVKVEDPANSLIKTYNIQKYATGALKTKKETIEVKAKDVNGQIVPAKVITESSYDEKGNLMSFVDFSDAGKPQSTLYTYTAGGETKSIDYPDGKRIEYIYASNTAAGERTVTEINSKKVTQNNVTSYAEESRIIKKYNQSGDLIFLSEFQAGETFREEVDYTYEYFPGDARKLKRRDALHRFVNVQDPSKELLRYTTFEERDEAGRVLRSRDDQGIDKEYEYRDVQGPADSASVKRIATVRESKAGDTTMHYYFYRASDAYTGLSASQRPAEYYDLDQDENEIDENDLDFVIQVRDRGTTELTDDEVSVVEYTGKSGAERIEKRLSFQIGGLTNLEKESNYVYHFDGSLDQVVDYRLERQGRSLVSTSTYKSGPGGDPRIDKITDAFAIKNHFYTATGRLERVEETNGNFPDRVITTGYNAFGDIVSVTDFYNRANFFEYIKNSQGRVTAVIETNNQDSGRQIRLMNAKGDVYAEMDKNGRVSLFDNKAHASQLGQVSVETRYLIEDASGWTTPWFVSTQGDFQTVLARLDKNGNGQWEDADLQALFNASGFPAGSSLRREQTYKLFNRQGDLVLSLTGSGVLSVYDYAKDVFEAKKQTQWDFYVPSALTGFARINLDDFNLTNDGAWTTLGEKILKAGLRDYDELNGAERTGYDNDRLGAVTSFLSAKGIIPGAAAVSAAKTIRRHNSDGQLIEEIDPAGIRLEMTYLRDPYGVPTQSFTKNIYGGVTQQELNLDGEIKVEKLTNGLIKEFTYTKDSLKNILSVTEKTLYPHDPQGTGSTEVRGLNLAGDVVKVIDKNGVVIDIVTRRNLRGERETTRTVRYTDTFNNVIQYSETEKTDRAGNVIKRIDKNGRVTNISYHFDTAGRILDAVEITEYVTESGQAIKTEEFFRYNAAGEQIYMRDKNGRQIEFESVKDSFGNTVEIRETEILASGAHALNVRRLSGLGENLFQTDKNGFTTAYAYDKDAKGNVIAAYESAKLRYDFSGDQQVDDGDLAQLTAAYGKTDAANLKRFDLSGDGLINEDDVKVLTTSREYGTRETPVTRFYSVFGDVLSLADRNGRKINYQYVKDALGNTIRSVESTPEFLGTNTRTFSRDGQVTSMLDQNGNRVRYSYTLDAKGNVLEIREEHELAGAPEEPRNISTVYNADGSYTETENDSQGLLRETKFNSAKKILSERRRGGLGENLARQAVLKTSESLNPSDNPASNLNNGIHDRNKVWFSKYNADPARDAEFIQLDLGQSKTISEVRFDNATQTDANFVRAFDVSTSEDGINWQKAGGLSNLVTQGIMTVTFPQIKARYVKIHNFQSSNKEGDRYYVTANEVEVFGPAWLDTNYTYTTDAQGNVTVTAVDSLGIVRMETKDNQGRQIYLKERIAENSDEVFGGGSQVSGQAHRDTGTAKFGDGSAAFDGSYDYLRFADSDTFDFSGGVWTMDFWMKTPIMDREQYFYGQGDAGNNKVYMKLLPGGYVHMLYETPSTGPITLISKPDVIKTNTWQHIAIVENGDVYRIYVDGIDQTGNPGVSYFAGKRMRNFSGFAQIGSHAGVNIGYGNDADGFMGLIDEFRISNGIARWTSNFTPPAQEYTSDTYTKLLLHSDEYKYRYTEQFTTVDLQGNTTATTTDSTGLLRQEVKDSQGRSTYLKERKPDDNSGFGNQITVGGNARTDALNYKFGGAAAALDGNGDYLGVPNNPDFNFGSSDFTIDFWVKFNSLSTDQVFWSLQNTGNPDNHHALRFRYAANGSLIFDNNVEYAGSTYINKPWSPDVNQWHHVALVRRGSTYELFVNGQSIGANVQANPSPAYDGMARIGCQWDTLAQWCFNGELDEFRISRGTARWTSNFVPPAAEYTPDAQTKLLLHFNGYKYDEQTTVYTADAQNNTTAVTTDSTGLLRQEIKNAQGETTYLKERKAEINSGFGDSMTVNGDAKAINSQSASGGKLGDGVAAFDGSGDYLSIVNNPDFDFGTGDFTIDAWVKLTSTGVVHTVASKYAQDVQGWIFVLDSANGVMRLYDSGWTAVSVPASFQADVWTHVAVVRSGNTIKFFKNGIQQGSNQTAASDYNGDAIPLKIGIYENNTAAFKGQMDELRISKGVARWTSNFIPSAQEYISDDYTKLLLHFSGYRYEESVPEEIYDAAGKLIRVDKHLLKDGKEYLVRMGEMLTPSTQPAQEGAPLPIVRAANSSLNYAERVFDGKFGTSFYARANIGGTMTLELEQPAVIGRMDTYFHRDQGVQYQIEASLDGENWGLVLDKTSPAGTFYRGVQSDTFSPVKAKYLRLRVTKSENNNSDFSLEEIRIYPPKGWPVTSTVTRTFNIQGDLLTEVQSGGQAQSYVYQKDALDNVVRVDEVQHKTNRQAFIKSAKNDTGGVLDKSMFDENRTTSNGAGKYFVFELTEPTELNEVRMLLKDSNDTSIYSYWIEVSNDGTAWTRVVDHFRGDARSWQRDQFAPVKARFVKIGGQDVSTTSQSSFELFETQFFAAPTSVVDYVTVKKMDQILSPDRQIAHSVTAAGDAQISTSDSKFGGSSARFDGDGDELVLTDNPDFDLGNSDFTIDTWVRLEDANQTGVIAEKFTGSQSGYTIYVSAGLVYFYFDGNVFYSQTKLSANTWYHLAVVRSGNSFKMFVNGKSEALLSSSAAVSYQPSAFRIGSRNGNSVWFKGSIDEFRFSKGIARWAENFAPPVQEYVSDSYTKLLLHMNGANHSRIFENSAGPVRFNSKEGQVMESIDRSGKITRTSYEYDAAGNQIGTYQLTQRGSGVDSSLEFSGEVRDSYGRVIKQISDSGQVTYYSYDLDQYGNIKKAYIRDSPEETVTVSRNILNDMEGVMVSGTDWQNIQTQSNGTNYLFDNIPDNRARVNNPNDNISKPLTIDFRGAGAVAANGDTQITTAQSKLGGSAAYFDGNQDYLNVANNPDFDFGTGDFTIEAWINLEDLGRAHTIASKYDANAVGWIWVVNPGNRNILLYDSGNSSVTLHNVPLFEAGRWYHMAVVRSGNKIKFFRDGVQIDSDQDISSSRTFNGGATSLKVGIYENTSHFKGQIDELRISKGIARWTSNFVLPAQEYTSDSYTKLLLHMNGANGSTNFVNEVVPAGGNAAAPVSKSVDITRIRLLTTDRPNTGYRVEVTKDGNIWIPVADKSTGGLKKEWYEHEINVKGVQKLRIIPTGFDYLDIDDLQIFSPASSAGDSTTAEKNFQIVREYDSRGNVLVEKNILFAIWESRPDLKTYFPDPQKKAIWGKWKDKTILDWAKAEGYLEDPRLRAYTPQLEMAAGELKDAFDRRRDLQRRFTDDAGLLDWAQAQGNLTNPLLEAYSLGRVQNNDPAAGTPLPPQINPVGTVTTTTSTANDNTTTTLTDSVGIFRQETKDAQGRIIFVNERKLEGNAGFGDSVGVNGNAKTSDSQYKFGGGAGSFDGIGDSINLPNSDDWNFGTGDFTIDFQVRFNSPPANNVTFIDRNNSNDFRVSRTNGVLTVHLEGTDYAMGAWSPLPEAWYHVAVVRRGSTLFGFINGVELGSTDAPKNIQGTDGIYLGSTSIDTQHLNGTLDEFRISKG
ncbi:MAG: discoidin domain-containing protein, partial [Candidatus Omnitrophica bacterium]|nr:discoidin domain-containing protein [Candidatus Omnitrophota bacterium]